jgi:hypothetical protein
MDNQLKLVPTEPTDAMQAAGAQAVRMDTTVLNRIWTANAVFRAMVAAAPPCDAVGISLSDEQRVAIEWAAGRAHVESLGKPLAGPEGQRWRVLSDLFRAALRDAHSETPSEDGPDATFRRTLGLRVRNLTVNDKNEVTWIAVECRGKQSSLQIPAKAGAPLPPDVHALLTECAEFHGKMVNGNWLSSEAAKLLAAHNGDADADH